MDRHPYNFRVGALALAGLIATCSGVARAQLPKAPTHDVEPSAEARHEFQLGVDMLQDPDGARYEEAYRQFLRAYALAPSWKILGNLGLSAFKLERFADGIDAYDRYLKAAGRDLDPTERQQIERDLEFMKSSSASLELTFTGTDGALTIQDTRQRAVGGPIINSYQIGAMPSTTLRLMAGTHTLSISSGAKHAVLDLSLQSGDKATRTVDLTAAASAGPAAPASAGATTSGTGPTAPVESKSSLRTVGMVVGGVGVLAVVGGVVTYFMGSSKKSDLEKRCPNSTCMYSTTSQKQSFEDDKSSLKTLGAATTGLLIGGGVLAAAGATLFVVGGPSKREQLALSAGPTGSGFAFAARGSF